MNATPLTHGERYVYLRENIDFKQDSDSICNQLTRLPKRMSRDDAMQYYGKKITDFFGVGRKDFLKVEHYFDYHEAMMILKQIRMSG